MNRQGRIYLDHNAAAQVDPTIIEHVTKHLRECIGNPSSVHSFGRECRGVLVHSRDTIAAFLGVSSDEIIFTSGATEGANLILKGWFQKQGSAHIITTVLEHPAVYQTIKELERLGCQVTYLETGELGAPLLDAVEREVRSDTKLIAIMGANNETGVKTDIERIARLASFRGIPFFVDGAALLGKELFQIPEGVSAMCFSGQKIHALQGSGFCFIRKSFKLAPFFTGGAQEFGKRAGTENLPGIISLKVAINLLQAELPAAAERMRTLRNHFEASLVEKLEGILINGLGPRVVNTSNLAFLGVDGESLLTALDMEGIAASHGSACASGALEPSRVLLNMELSRQRVNSSLRFSLSRMTTMQEIERAVEVIVSTVDRMRKLRTSAPSY